MTVAELIKMLESVENKDSKVDFHSISNRAYQDAVVQITTSKYTNKTTVVIK